MDQMEQKELTSKIRLQQRQTRRRFLLTRVQYGRNHQGSELIANDKVYAGAYCCTYESKYKDDLYVISQSFGKWTNVGK